MEDLISIIIPVYNVDEYLDKCLKSVINQTYKNIEIILINDGSTDNSLNICKLYEKRYRNILLIDKKNEGVSIARNVGINMAKGEYITFVDSDDWIEKDYTEVLYRELKKDDFDLIISNGIVFNDLKIVESNKINENIQFTSEEAIKELLLEKRISSSCWGNIYKKNIINKIKFDSNMRIAEDMKFMVEVIERCTKIKVIKDEKYHYYLRKNSAVRSGFNDKWYDELNYCEVLIHKYKNSSLKNYAVKRFMRVNLFCATLSNLNKKDRTNIKYNLVRYKKEYFNSRLNNFKEKIKLIVVLYFPSFVFLWQLKNGKYNLK